MVVVLPLEAIKVLVDLGKEKVRPEPDMVGVVGIVVVRLDQREEEVFPRLDSQT